MASEYITRAEAGDQPALHRLWETVFGDPPELVEAFFYHFPPEVAGWVVRREDKICSAAYLLPGNWYLDGSSFHPAGYVYAVATAPEERGKGYARRLMRTLADAAESRDLLLYTRPAEASLFSWYAKNMGAEQISRMCEQVIDLDLTRPLLPCSRISPAEYAALRENLLAQTPHIVLAEPFLRLQERYSDGFYAVGSGCAAAVQQEKTLYLSELLTAEAQQYAAVQSLLHVFRLPRAVVRLQGAACGAPLASYCGPVLSGKTNWGLFLE